MAKFLCLLTLLLGLFQPVAAQTLTPAQPFIINADFSRFRGNAASGYLELYYSFYCGLITYRLDGALLKGGVALHTDLINTTTGQAVLKEKVVVPVVLEDTTMATWRSMSILRQAGHVVPFGNYRLHIVAYDSINSARRDSLTFSIEVKAFAGRPTLSDLQLCASIKASTDRSNPYFKNAHEVMSHPSLTFGAVMPVIYVYSELYDVDTSKIYTLDYEIFDASGASAKKVSRQRRYRTPNTIEVGTLNAVALNVGRYTLRMTLREASAGQPVQTQKEFFTYQSPTASAAPPTKPTSVALALEMLTEKEVDDEFQRAKYLAEKAEISFYSQLKSGSAKKEFLKEFWGRREAGSATDAPYPRADYLRRVVIADERYSSYTKKGWRTDRGRVFILYGKPDEVERHPSAGVTKPYEIWYFYQIENSVQFVFVDKNGFGDYELVHSTKRGEFSDEDWERYLQ